MLVAKVVIRFVAMKKFRITGRSLFVTGSMGMKQPWQTNYLMSAIKSREEKSHSLLHPAVTDEHFLTSSVHCTSISDVDFDVSTTEKKSFRWWYYRCSSGRYRRRRCRRACCSHLWKEWLDHDVPVGRMHQAVVLCESCA